MCVKRRKIEKPKAKYLTSKLKEAKRSLFERKCCNCTDETEKHEIRVPAIQGAAGQREIKAGLRVGEYIGVSKPHKNDDFFQRLPAYWQGRSLGVCLFE